MQSINQYSKKKEDTLREVRKGKVIQLRQLYDTDCLGQWGVQCKQPASSKFSGCSCGTIYPIEIDIPIQTIKERMAMGHTSFNAYQYTFPV